MSLKDDGVFIESLRKSTGNPYAAVMMVANSARKLCNEYEGVLRESEAITCVMQGKVPDLSDRKVSGKKHKPYSDLKSTIDAVLQDVDDTTIKEYVRQSAYESDRLNHLQYVYPKNCDEDAAGRIRVLTNMIWYADTSSSVYVPNASL